MDWNSIVQQLGWQDVVSKWEHSESCASDQENFPEQESSNRANLLKALLGQGKEFRKDEKINYYTPTTINQQCTNPFLTDDKECTFHAPARPDSWFYRDPHGYDQGPFNTAEMATWYDTGYFDENLTVRRADETEFITIADLIRRKSSEILSSFHLSEPMSVVHLASIINPFRSMRPNPVLTETVDKMPNATETVEYKADKYSFNICRGLERLKLKESKPENNLKQNSAAAPIKFSLIGPKKTALNPAREERKAITREDKVPNSNFSSKLNKLQKYWMDVANSKLVGPQLAIEIEVEINGEILNALLEPAARVSFLGKGSVEFLERHNIYFVQYNTSVRSVKSEHGTVASIIGHVLITINYKNLQIVDLKVLVAPSLDRFLYLGTDFSSNFTSVKASQHPFHHSVTKLRNDIFLHDLEPQRIAELEKTKNMFLCLTKHGLGITDLVVYSINVTGSLVSLRNTVVPIKAEHSVLKELDRMIALDIIEESSSLFTSSVISMKGQGEFDLCLDLKKINAIIKPDKHSLPSRCDILKRIKASTYISSLDLTYINFQIPMDKQSRQLTGFEVDGRPKYNFKRMPFGIKNTWQTINRLMNKIFPTELRDACLVLSNELLVLSGNFNSHVKDLACVAKHLNGSGIRVNVQKSSFFMSALKCYGYIVGSKEQKFDPEAYKPITGLSRPATKKQMANFIQITKWFKVFIPNYNKVIAPLKLLQHTKMDTDTVTFTSEPNDAFVFIKRSLANDASLQEPNFKLPMFVQCNVNYNIIAGLLYQIDESDQMRPIAYCIKELSTIQKDFCITELECLALVTILRQFQCYVDGFHFYVATDKQILSWILKETQLPPRLARWCIELQKYNFTLKQRKQDADQKTDILNRIDFKQKNQIEMDLKSFKKSFPDYEELRNKIITSPNDFPDFVIKNDLIYCRRVFSCGDPLADENLWKLYIPELMRKAVVEHVHANVFGVHQSVKDMKACLQTEFYWPSIGEELRKVIKNCKRCSEQN